MNEIKTSNPRFTIFVDHYPYTETKYKIKTELGSWYDIKENRGQDIDNYHLDSDDPRSLGFSLEHRLQDGHFAFLYLDDVCLCFCGLQRRDDSAWVHRLFTNPIEYVKHLGSISAYLTPFQVKTAREWGCRNFKFTYTGRNVRFYNFYRDRLYLKSRYYRPEYLSGPLRISRFDFVGKQIVNMTEQWVINLDLTRDDIDEFCVF